MHIQELPSSQKRGSKTILVIIAICAYFLGAAMKSWAGPAKNNGFIINSDAVKFLHSGVWRTNDCNGKNFQYFSFDNKTAPKSRVIVGAGEGFSESLELVHAFKKSSLIQIKTHVCAPIGCNETWEEYKVTDANTIKEWTFEGHLPNEAPNIVVTNGVAKDGSLGRVFKRCAK